MLGDVGRMNVFERIGRAFVGSLKELGEGFCFAWFSLWAYFKSKKRLPKFILAVWHLGCRCLPVILLIGLFTGLVLGLQGAHTLGKFGATSLLGSAVALSLVRELAPVLTGLVVVGQAGSSLCSELGIYRQGEQINALRLMGVSPEAYLVGAPLLSSIIVFPILVSVFCLLGLGGGYLSGVSLSGVDAGVYWNSAYESVGWTDVGLGLVKAVLFGFTTVGICCYAGFNCHRLSRERGARAVAQLTTHAVILSSVAILVLDYLATAVSLKLL